MLVPATSGRSKHVVPGPNANVTVLRGDWLLSHSTNSALGLLHFAPALLRKGRLLRSRLYEGMKYD